MPDEGGLDELVGEEQQNIRTMDMGTRSPDTEGLATAMPPTALVIDTAGVRTPSAIVRAVPKSDYTQSSRFRSVPLVRPGESTYPYQKREANPVLERYAMLREWVMVLLVAFTSQGSVGIEILLGSWIETLEEGEGSALPLFCPKEQ